MRMRICKPLTFVHVRIIIVQKFKMYNNPYAFLCLQWLKINIFDAVDAIFVRVQKKCCLQMKFSCLLI